MLLPTRKFAALPFVVFGVLDYLRVAHVKGAGGSPTDLLLRSPTLFMVGRLAGRDPVEPAIGT